MSHHVKKPRRGYLGLAAALGLVGLTLTALPSSAAETPAGSLTPATEAYSSTELQARTNLLVNDEGFNLPPGSSFNSITPDINTDGGVAFRVQVVPDPGDLTKFRPGIWLGGHGSGGVVYTGDHGMGVDSDTSLNDEGDIAFTFSDGGYSNHLYRYDSDTSTAEVVGTSPVIPSNYGNPHITESGDIGFLANFSGARSYAAVIDGSGVIYASDNNVDPDSPYTYLYPSTSNDADQVAAKVATSDDLTSEVEIRVFDGDGSSHRVLANNAVDPDSPYSQFNNSVGLSDNGTVAAIATRAADGKQVVVRSDGETTTEIAAADPEGEIRELEYFTPDVNDAGQVAFRAVDTGGEGLYVGDGDSLTRVIGKGDVVETDLGTGQLGQHDDSPVFGGGPSINEGGDIAFTAGLHPEGDNQVEWGSGVFVAYAADSGEPVGTLSGSVTDANDDGPIAAATVTVRRPDGSVAAEATTGVGGTYQMSPPPGTYTVTASADRYLSQTVETAISSEQPATADLALATAVIKAKPGALEFSGGPGQVHEATLRIANTGSADLAWSLDSNKPWLSVETGSGDVRPGNVQALTVTADSTGLPPGSEQAAKLVIHGNAGRQRTVRVPVTLTITQQPCVGWMLGFC